MEQREGACYIQRLWLHWHPPEPGARAQAHGAACAAVYELLRGAVALHARLAGFLGQLRAGGFLQCSLASLVAVRRPQKHAVRYIGLIVVVLGVAGRKAPLTGQPKAPQSSALASGRRDNAGQSVSGCCWRRRRAWARCCWCRSNPKPY